MRVFYFGAMQDRLGHAIWPWDKDHLLPDALRPQHLDCVYCPGYRDRVNSYDQPQGYAALHHVHGWTILALWDRTVDSRPNSNSAFLVEGNLTFEEMQVLAQRHFPSVWKRITSASPVVLAEKFST